MIFCLKSLQKNQQLLMGQLTAFKLLKSPNIDYKALFGEQMHRSPIEVITTRQSYWLIVDCEKGFK